MDRETARRVGDHLIASERSSSSSIRAATAKPRFSSFGVGSFILPILVSTITTVIALENGAQNTSAIMLGVTIGLAFAFAVVRETNKVKVS